MLERMHTSDALLTGGAALIVAGCVLASKRPKKNSPSAVCVFEDHGFVLFIPHNRAQTLVECHLDRLVPGEHGMHVHDAGDLRLGCKSGCSHYNPDKSTHGGPNGPRRHRGDLGNIHASSAGMCITKTIADVRVEEIVGRMLVIHEDEDDLGLGGDDESLKTGNAGKRLLCSVIGLAKPH